MLVETIYSSSRTRSLTEGRPVTRYSFYSPEDLEAAEEALIRSLKKVRKQRRINKIFRLKKELTSIRKAIRTHLRENPNAPRNFRREANTTALNLLHAHKPLNEGVSHPEDDTYTRAMETHMDVVSRALTFTHQNNIRT